MDRETAIQELAVVVEGIAVLSLEIARQERIVVRLEASGRKTTDAKFLLQLLKELQALRETERDDLVSSTVDVPTQPAHGE